MEDQIVRIDKEQEAISDADLARKLLKKEQRLFARLQEAQEAEARALDRFRRVQARLQRRKARLERIKSHLLLVRKQIADQQPAHVEPVLAMPATPEPTTMTDSEGIADQQPEHVEPVLAMPATPEPTAMTDSEEITPVQSEPELVATPDSTTVAVSTTTEPELIATSDSIPVAVPTTTEPESISLSDTEFAVTNTIEPEVDATPSDSTEEREPTKPLLSGQETQPTAVSLPQDISSAKEAWVTAESAMQYARNAAHGLAASISFLSQTGGLSNDLMAELLRRQSEANKALLKAQNAARLAYEKFVQAQEDAERAASQPVDVSMDTSEDHTQQNQENGTSPTEEDNVVDQTVQMHAVRLYKEW